MKINVKSYEAGKSLLYTLYLMYKYNSSIMDELEESSSYWRTNIKYNLSFFRWMVQWYKNIRYILKKDKEII